MPSRSSYRRASDASSVDLYDGYIAPAEGGVPRETVLTYDEDRALTEVEQPDGTSLLYTYAPNGRLNQASIPGAGTYTYGYNAGGQLKSITTTGGFGDLSIEYAPRATTGVPSDTPGPFPLLISTSGQFAAGSWGGTLAGSVEYSYSNRMLPLSVQPRAVAANAHGNRVTFNWDGDQLLSSIVPTAPSPALTFTRSSLDGHVTSTSIGTVTTTYDVDVNSSTPGTGDLDGMSASISSSPVFSATYQRDQLGRITRLDETVQGTPTTRQYAYDGAGRLIAVLDGSDVVVSEYEYDGNGARTRALTPSGEVELGTNLGCGVSLTTPVDAQDRLCRYGEHEYGYDDNGRLLTKTNLSTSAVTQYAYDGLGRLRSVILPDTTEIDYVHDALGRRVGKAVNNVLVRGWRYGHDSLKPIAQLNALGVIEKTFVYGTRVNVPELIIDRIASATYRIIVDPLGSVRLVINVANGAVVQRMDYDEFGNVDANTYYVASGFSQPFGFAGGLYDADTGLVRFGARDYDAVTGRWTAKDPLLFGDGTNVYSYVNGDPVNYFDSTGLLAQAAWGALAGFGVSVALELYRGGGDFGRIDWTNVAVATAAGALTAGISAGVLASTASFGAKTAALAASGASLGAGAYGVSRGINQAQNDAANACVGDGNVSLGGFATAAGTGALSGAWGAGKQAAVDYYSIGHYAPIFDDAGNQIGWGPARSFP